jgi:undecaprenyl pyrophosphate synthase
VGWLVYALQAQLQIIACSVSTHGLQTGATRGSTSAATQVVACTTCLQDLTQAARTIAQEVQAGTLDPGDVNEEVLVSRLSTASVMQQVGPVE